MPSGEARPSHRTGNRRPATGRTESSDEEGGGPGGETTGGHGGEAVGGLGRMKDPAALPPGARTCRLPGAPAARRVGQGADGAHLLPPRRRRAEIIDLLQDHQMRSTGTPSEATCDPTQRPVGDACSPGQEVLPVHQCSRRPDPNALTLGKLFSRRHYPCQGGGDGRRYC